MRVTGETGQTSLSLIEGVRDRDPVKWNRFCDLFSPLIYDWCRRSGVSQDDAPDVMQDFFTSVASSFDSFRRETAGDSFHGWLWTITRHRVLDHFRRLARQPAARGGSSAAYQINQHPDMLPRQLDEESLDIDTQRLYRRALELLKAEFEQKTWTCFLRLTADEAAPADVANELGMTVGAVYNAKCKVLRRLREELSGLLPIGAGASDG
jgi:RNA polymerase sigma-70 factor (ECF subfamily)